MQHLRGALLPEPSPSFTKKKNGTLRQLNVADDDYKDASPKGTVDSGIRGLIDEINKASGLVTTSSCAGRVSVFLEGRKTLNTWDEGNLAQQQIARVGGKGAGGTWLFVSHDPVAGDDWIEALSLQRQGAEARSDPQQVKRWIHFKFEPMILHVLTASLGHAQLLLRAALQAGFRESGAINIASQSDSSVSPIVAIRSMGLGFESLVGFEDSDGTRHATVSPAYLRDLMDVGNERFVENTKRIERFSSAFKELFLNRGPQRRNPEGQDWEDAVTRKARMRAEGLKRRAALGRKTGHDDGMNQDRLSHDEPQ